VRQGRSGGAWDCGLMVASRLLVVLQLERRDVVVQLRPARAAGVER
jgi:hypothetical protein